MNSKEKAQEIFNRFYMILFDSESDKGEEILVSLLARKCAIEAVNQIIKSNPHSNPLNTGSVSDLGFWFKVQKELVKM